MPHRAGPALVLLHPLVSAGGTACISKQLDWYTDVVGETPCMTYQRLRQICNPDYQVPTFRTRTPGDTCDDQVYCGWSLAACCCNTVAFQLSMLCMNCQYDTVDGNTVGYDTDPGTYAEYKGSCGAGTNHSLPADIQQAVCNKDIRLDNFLYGGWDDGSWFYVWTKENAGREHAANNNNVFTHCPDQISHTTTQTPTTTNTPISTNQPVTTTTTSSPQSIVSPTSPTSPTSTQTNAAGKTSTSSPISATGTSSFTQLAQTLGDSSPTQESTGSAGGNGTLLVPLSTPTESAGSTTAAVSSKSNTGAIVGGVVGGAGVIVLLYAGYVAWRIRRDRRRRQDAWLHGDSSEGPVMSTTRMGGPVVTRPVSASGSSRRHGPGSSWSASGTDPTTIGPSDSASNAVVPMFAEDQLRHEDGGSVAELVRSTSGRLPPAYHSLRTRSTSAVPDDDSREPALSPLSSESHLLAESMSMRSAHGSTVPLTGDVKSDGFGLNQ
ncbi:hypothetical protein C8Q74DRAFT_1217424 [Fomes fomentarius]|nr:hypothetical protein C8Q74DRAFT_1217424 [Fomes fomentarius]